MNKCYRVFLILLLLILLIANITFFAYNSEFMAYFNLDAELETPEQIIEKAKTSPVPGTGIATSLDLSIINDPKFENLKDFKVDLTDFELPDDLVVIDEETGEVISGPDPSREEEFEVGNTNPFSPSF